MKRIGLLNLLDAHTPYDPHETAMLCRMRRFVEGHDDCFERSLQVGHITGSAWIVDSAHGHVLLTHHAKLDMWLQLGGHADGDSDVLRVALREAREESGLEEIVPISTAIFDVDIHDIPARGDEPMHQHYDVRFLLRADRHEPLVISSESKELLWVPLDRLDELNPDDSVRRMAEKTRLLSAENQVVRVAYINHTK